MPRILVTDDEEQIRELLKEVLGMQGYQIDTCVNGQEAVERLKTQAYDLVILDRNMPIMTGIEAIAAIRASADPRVKAQKILMFTSASIVTEIDEAFRSGADDYLLKPLNLTAILQKVKTVLGI